MDIDALAKEFSAQMRQTLTSRQLAKVNRLNKAETDPGICHSHDFIDANETMLAAWEKVSGRTYDQDFGEDALDDAANCAMWSKAWAKAQAAEFKL